MTNKKFSIQSKLSAPDASSKSPPETSPRETPIELVFDCLADRDCSPRWLRERKQIVALCPLHCDKKMSLVIAEIADGLEVTCSSKCFVEDIYATLGLSNHKRQNDDVIEGTQRTKDLLESVCKFVCRFVVLPGPASEVATALFVLHTWAFDAAHATPYLAVVSAEKQSGKTRLLEVLELLVRKPWRTSSTTEAALFRKIEQDCPTLLLDEIDAIFGASTERTEPLRAALNAGNREGAKTTRVVGQGPHMEARDFSVFCPKVLAGIDTGRLPETIQDRSVTLHMKRRRTGEDVERLRYRLVASEVEPLRAELATWGAVSGDRLRSTTPDLPNELADRAADAWEPLLAIADDAGGDWPIRARLAAVELRASDDEASRGTQILDAMRRAMAGKTTIFTEDLLEVINGDEDLPFGAWNDTKGLDGRGLARLLKPYGVRPGSVRDGSDAKKGYRSRDLADVWARYLSPLEGSHASPADQESVNTRHKQSDVTDVTDVTDAAEAEDDPLV